MCMEISYIYDSLLHEVDIFILGKFVIYDDCWQIHQIFDAKKKITFCLHEIFYGFVKNHHISDRDKKKCKLNVNYANGI